MKRLESIKGAIFDLDGTLLDSMDVWTGVDRIFFERRGMEVPPDFAAIITPLGFAGAAAYTIQQFQFAEEAEDIIAEWFALAGTIYAEEVELKQYAYEYLQMLSGRGVKLAVATASDAELFEPCLRRHGIYDWFDTIVTVREVSRGKGFPDIYEKAAQNMGFLPQECAVFEDIFAGVKGAKDGGFLTVGVEDAHSCIDKEIIRQISNIYIQSWKELL